MSKPVTEKLQKIALARWREDPDWREMAAGDPVGLTREEVFQLADEGADFSLAPGLLGKVLDGKPFQMFGLSVVVLNIP
jgi:hypothetical protein